MASSSTSWLPLKGLWQDIIQRAECYRDDWTQAINAGFKLVWPSLYMTFATLLPTLVFGALIEKYSRSTFTVAHSILSTSLSNLLQASMGGQPLLILSISEPTVLMYKYIYTFLEKLDATDKYKPFCTFVTVWSGCMHMLISMLNGGEFARRYFSRFFAETFGVASALIFAKGAILGLKSEFKLEGDSISQKDELVNGLWAIIIVFFQLILALALTKARAYPYFTKQIRTVMGDFGPPIAFAAAIGLSYSLRPAPSSIPVRLDGGQIYSHSNSENLKVAKRMSDLSYGYILGALVPSFLLTLFTYFAHNIALSLCQQSDFNLKKPYAYNLDSFVLGLTFLLNALLGLPPSHGALPHAPLHTQSLMGVEAHKNSSSLPTAILSKVSRTVLAKDDSSDSSDEEAETQQRGNDPSDNADEIRDNGASGTCDGQVDGGSRDAEASENGNWGNGKLEEEIYVREQRATNLSQSILVGAFTFLGPAIRRIPRACVWSYLFFMALEVLPGNLLAHKLTLLLTERCHRRGTHPGDTVPIYVDTVPFNVITRFTLIQLTCVAGIFALTFNNTAGFFVPMALLSLLPARYTLMPSLFRPRHLNALDQVIDIEEVLEEEPSEVMKEEEEDVHNYFSGQELGGYGAFGQVSHPVHLRHRHHSNSNNNSR